MLNIVENTSHMQKKRNLMNKHICQAQDTSESMSVSILMSDCYFSLSVCICGKLRFLSYSYAQIYDNK